MQFPSRRKSESYAETSPRIQADSRIMAPGKGEVEPLFPTASRRLADDSQLSKPRDSQQVHSRTLETTAETCRPLSSEGGLYLPPNNRTASLCPKAVLPRATAHLCV